MSNIKDYFEDFELWAEECVTITDKMSGMQVPFMLNRPQKRVLGELENMRREGRPIRLIMLKARQWGGSTLIEAYMAWMQLVRREGWNALVCAHVKDASAGIRGTYSRLLRNYPDRLKTTVDSEGNLRPDPKAWTLQPYEKTGSMAWIAARGSLLGIASAQAPDSVRGFNFHMAHLSEVAFWGEGESEAAEKIVRTVSGTVPLCADSLIVMESTANGRDNYFYKEWKRASSGKSDKRAVFVPWYEIDIYKTEPLSLSEVERLRKDLDAYELQLIDRMGVEPERVAWYHRKRREYPTHEAMMAEFPSTPEEAFLNGDAACAAPNFDVRDAITDSLRIKGIRAIGTSAGSLFR